VIAPIQGGYNVQERIQSATFLSEYHEDVLGFLFDGFFTDGNIVEEISSDLILPIIDKTMVLIIKTLLYFAYLNFICTFIITNILFNKEIYPI